MEQFEVWKAVVNCKGEYEVSDKGRVRSLDRVCRRFSRRVGEYFIVKRGKVLVLNVMQSSGYRYVDLRGRNRSIRCLVHRLVLEAFVGPCPEGLECRHLDGDRGNNRLENICWGTKAENWDDKRRHGTLDIVRGERHPHSKLDEAKVRAIRERHSAGERQAKLGREFGIHQVTVSEIVTRKIWAHVG